MNLLKKVLFTEDDGCATFMQLDGFTMHEDVGTLR